MRTRIYIAGPITRGDLYHNLRQAGDAFKKLAHLGYAPFNPMLSCYADGPVSFDGDVFADAKTLTAGLSHREWLEIDLSWAACSHALLRLPGESLGADTEVDKARMCGIPVFHGVDELFDRLRTEGGRLRC